MALTTATKTLVDALPSTSTLSAQTSLASHSTYHGSVGSALKEVYGILRYKALLTQSGTNAPTATELENTTGATMTWSRVGANIYRVTASSSVFTLSKTLCFLTNGDQGTATYIRCGRSSNTTVDVYVTESYLVGASLSVEIYP